MNETNDFALVPRPPGALAEAQPGAKRILSGMVSDTLALAEGRKPSKPQISVAVCGCSDLVIQEFIEAGLRAGLANQATAELQHFVWTTEFIEATRHSRFELFVVLLNPGIYTRKATASGPPERELNWDDQGDELNAYELIASLKKEFGKPVFVISNASKYDSRAELEKAGADAVFWMPFTLEELHTALRRCLKPQLHKLAKQPSPQPSRPLRIVSVDDEPCRLEMVEVIVSEYYEGVTVRSFQDPEDAWKELLRSDPDLLITDDIMGKLNGDELVRRLAERKAAYPIIVINGFGPERDQWVLDWAERGMNVTMLRAPYAVKDLRNLVEAALKIPAGRTP